MWAQTFEYMSSSHVIPLINENTRKSTRVPQVVLTKTAGKTLKLPLKIVQLDVTDDGSVKNAMQSIIAEASRIDVLVNNAGYALNDAFEDLAMEELKAQYETNLFGVTRVTQAAIPIMRKQKSGIIVNISSGGFPGGSVYVSVVHCN